MALPLLLHLPRDLRITITRQVNQSLRVTQIKKVDQLSSTRGFTGARQLAIVGQGINSAGFAGIGSPGKRHLDTSFGRTFANTGCALGKTGSAKYNVAAHKILQNSVLLNGWYIMRIAL